MAESSTAQKMRTLLVAHALANRVREQHTVPCLCLSKGPSLAVGSGIPGVDLLTLCRMRTHSTYREHILQCIASTFANAPQAMPMKLLRVPMCVPMCISICVPNAT